eukprot:Lankesteria_metandrocarpae@DN5151_c1_g1_i3.p1
MDMFEGLVFVFCSIILNTSFVGITDACVGRGNDGLIANSKANSSRGGLHHRSRKQQDSQQQSEDHPTTAGDVERQQQEPVSCEAPPSAAAIASVEGDRGNTRYSKSDVERDPSTVGGSGGGEIIASTNLPQDTDSRGGLHHRSRKQQDSQQQSEDHPTTAGDVERQQQEPVSCEAPPSAAAIASVERAPQQLTDSASSGHVAKGRGAMSHAEIWDIRRRIIEYCGNKTKLSGAQSQLRRYQRSTVVAAHKRHNLEMLESYLSKLTRSRDTRTQKWANAFEGELSSSELGAIILVQIGDCKTVVQVRQTENDSALEGAS